VNPNSAHQTWSLWTAIVDVPFHRQHVTKLFEAEMQRASATFYRRLFGSASEMKITRSLAAGQSRFVVECRTEGSPAQEPVFRKRRMDELAAFFGKNLCMYGKVDVRVDVRIEAGDPGTGAPPTQLILAPSIPLDS